MMELIRCARCGLILCSVEDEVLHLAAAEVVALTAAGALRLRCRCGTPTVVRLPWDAFVLGVDVTAGEREPADVRYAADRAR